MGYMGIMSKAQQSDSRSEPSFASASGMSGDVEEVVARVLIGVVNSGWAGSP